MTAALSAMNSMTQPHPMVNGSGNEDKNTSSATISANDFLTLLVTEMKNQDPTAQTDPNEYINQLVQVNSLEQLIEINQNLSTAEGSSTSGHAVPAGASMSATHASGTVSGSSDSGQRPMKGISTPIPLSPVSTFAGNLGVSKPIPAAQRIAQALNGRQ